MSLSRKALFSALLLLLAVLAWGGHALAAGNIVSGSQTSQFFNLDLNNDSVNDRINWSPTSGGATVTDTAVTGSIWGETVGWINLSPTNGGVTNICTTGVLGGSAWGENTGWVNFAPTHGGVTINPSTGEFSGSAWTENDGWINFSCPGGNTCVKTTWAGCGTTSTPPTGGTPGGGSSNGSTDGPYPYCTVSTATNYGSLLPCQYSHSQPPTGPTTGPGGPTGPGTSATTGPGTGPGNPSGPGNNNTTSNPPGGNGTGGFPGPTIDNPPSTSSTTGSIIDNNGPIGSPNPGPENPIFPWLGQLAKSPIAEAVVGLVGLLAIIPGLLPRFAQLIFSIFVWGRKKPWGVVYDSVTKEPLDPAYLVLTNTQTGEQVADAITDLDGRYGFLLKQGTYRLTASKTNYVFPSARLRDKQNDEVYGNLYFGAEFTVTDENKPAIFNIPMDPTGTDWNQDAKKKQSLYYFFRPNEKFWNSIFDLIYVVGFIASIYIAYVYPNNWNYVMLGIYVLVLLLRIFGWGPVSVGHIYRNVSGLPHALISVYSKDGTTLITKRIADEEGRYYILIRNGTYQVAVSERKAEEHFEELRREDNISGKRGVIDETFHV